MHKNISLLHWHSRLCFTPFLMPVIVLYWEENGLNTLDIYLLQGIFCLSLVLLEVPTGMIADLLGKKKSLIIANLVHAFALLIYCTGHGFGQFLIAEILMGLAISFLSGADSALLYDTLKEEGREAEYQKVSGSMNSSQMFCFAICTLLGGFTAEYSLRFTMALSVIGPCLALLISLRLKEINPAPENESFKDLSSRYVSLVKDSKKFVWKHKLVRYLMIFGAILILGSRWLLWQYQPYFKLSGLPIWSFGMIFACFNIFAAVVSRYSYAVSQKLGREKTLVLLAVCQALPMIFMAWIVTPASFLFILGNQLVRGFYRPVLTAWILEYTFADKRATVLSINGLVAQLAFGAFCPIAGLIGQKFGLLQTLVIETCVMSCFFLVLWYFYHKIDAKYFVRKNYEGKF